MAMSRALALMLFLFLGRASFIFLYFFSEMDFFSTLLVIVLLKLRKIFLVMFIALNLSYVLISFRQSV